MTASRAWTTFVPVSVLMVGCPDCFLCYRVWACLIHFQVNHVGLHQSDPQKGPRENLAGLKTQLLCYRYSSPVRALMILKFSTW